MNRAAAIESYGPTMYDLVMSIAPNGLTADRASVTDDAKSLWQYYANNRSDVLKTYLDNSKDPKTPDTFDDTLYGHGSSDDYGPFSPTNIFDKKVVVSNGGSLCLTWIDDDQFATALTNGF